MKRIHSILAIAATVAAFASCAKETLVTSSERVSNIIPEGKKEILFSTAITKTTIDEGVPAWADKDSVKIIWVEEKGEGVLAVCDTTAAVNPADGTIAAVVGEARDYYYAVYPHWATSTVEASVDSPDILYVTVRSTSTDGSWAAAHYAAALTTEGEKLFNFKSVSNAVKFTVTTPGVTRVQIATPDQAMTAAKVKFAFDGEEIGENVEVVTPQITSTVTVNGPGTYYAPVICDAQWLSGFVISEYIGDNLASFSEAPNPIAWGRSEVYNIGTVEEHKTTTHDWFFKAEGEGTGESWDDAAGIDKFIELLSGSTGHLYINNQNLYLAAGSYNLAREGKPSVDIIFPMPTSVNILGGYPADATGTDLSGRNVTGNKTIIYSDTAEKNGRIFLYKGNTGAITIDGIQFGPYDSITQSVRGYAMYVNGDAGFSADNSLITFSNCTFTGIKGEYYGAIDLNNAAGKMKIEKCTFEGNQANKTGGFGGAGLFIEAAADLEVDNCTFTNNSATSNAFGGAVVISDGKVTITDCTFTGNSCNNYGGAVGVGADKEKTPDVVIKDCEFTSNTAQHAGALNHIFGTMLCEGCTFTKNTCTREAANVGGGAFATFYVSKDGALPAAAGDYPNRSSVKPNTTLKNCSFIENSAYGRGGAIHHLNSGTCLIDGCLFKGNYNSTSANGGGAIYHAGASGCSNLCIANTHFDSNYTQRDGSTNGSGAVLSTKNGAKIFFSNCSFTGNSTLSKSEGIISTSDTCEGLYMFRCTFLDNNPDVCVVRPGSNPAFIANCTFAETVKKYNKGIIYCNGTGTTTAINNIVISNDVESSALGTGTKTIKSGYNICTKATATLSPIEGATADVTGKLAADVFADATPSFDENYWIETKDLSGMMASVSKAAIKTAIQSASEDFYNWLESIKAFDTMPVENWQCGAYQK
ncbi:MAG: hypothetical protein MJY62_00820 [Bacteroidales bacterium]|nr:hypothetical protein [Bacteroidales bacterium]